MAKNIFKTEESRYNLVNALKFTMIPLFIVFVTAFVLWIFAQINYIFFEANGFPQVDRLRDAYFEFITVDVVMILPYVFVQLIAVFFIGLYLSFMLMRPFDQIGSYCEQKLNGENRIFKPNGFLKNKIPLFFSEYFFSEIDQWLKNDKWEERDVPLEYQKIHGPIMEKDFFIFFLLIVFSLILLNSISIYFIAVNMHDKIIDLAINVLDGQGPILYFLQKQQELIVSIMAMIIFIMIALFSFLALNLYHSVSGASFAIFSTMRSFIKGDLTARVHLIEYRYTRENCRYLNKYLNYVSEKIKNH